MNQRSHITFENQIRGLRSRSLKDLPSFDDVWPTMKRKATSRTIISQDQRDRWAREAEARKLLPTFSELLRKQRLESKSHPSRHSGSRHSIDSFTQHRSRPSSGDGSLRGRFHDIPPPPLLCSPVDERKAITVVPQITAPPTFVAAASSFSNLGVLRTQKRPQSGCSDEITTFPHAPASTYQASPPPPPAKRRRVTFADMTPPSPMSGGGSRKPVNTDAGKQPGNNGTNKGKTAAVTRKVSTSAKKRAWRNPPKAKGGVR